MKYVLLIGIAALLLATGATHAESEKWEASFRQCHIRKWFSKDELAAIGWARETGASLPSTRSCSSWTRSRLPVIE